MLQTMARELAPLHQGDPTKIATREAYGKALVELGGERSDVCVLDADLSGSTKTKGFSQAYPERFFNCGVAEANMMGIAAGIASMGKTVFASSFAMFATGKAWEQVRQSIAVPNFNVKIAATHAGLTVGEDGKSHQMLEDITLMRVIPGMRVLVPADAVEARLAIRAAAAEPGPFYVRLSRASTSVVFSEDYEFQIGKGALLRDGNDIAIVACGIEVPMALAAAEELAASGIEARVIAMASIKPIDEEILIEAANECGCVMTAEEHQIRGGLGSAVAEVLATKAPVPMAFCGMDDEFGQSGDAWDLVSHYKLDGPGLAASARKLLDSKQA
jgi:transketolase